MIRACGVGLRCYMGPRVSVDRCVLGGAFPEGFLWGVATSSFQVEMGRGDDANGSDWWAWVHDAENKRRGWVSGDVPEDGPGFWELYKRDLGLARGLGCNSFRMSLDWRGSSPTQRRASRWRYTGTGSGTSRRSG